MLKPANHIQSNWFKLVSIEVNSPTMHLVPTIWLFLFYTNKSRMVWLISHKHIIETFLCRSEHCVYSVNNIYLHKFHEILTILTKFATLNTHNSTREERVTSIINLLYNQYDICSVLTDVRLSLICITIVAFNPWCNRCLTLALN